MEETFCAEGAFIVCKLFRTGVMNLLKFLLIIIMVASVGFPSAAQAVASDSVMAVALPAKMPPADSLRLEQVELVPSTGHQPLSPYALPYTRGSVQKDWRRLWQNTAVLSSAFVGTLLVLECLPEGATAWNRAEIQSVPPFKRWWRNVFKRGPEWDHDNAIFNYILHPYAGAVYFMSARSCGFSYQESLLYSAAVSTIGWEFGIEAFMERPSYQDLVITPVIGSLIGELCYRDKREIMDNGYQLLGSSVVGHIAAILLDPVNGVLDLFRGDPSRRNYSALTLQSNAVALTIVF